MSETGQNEFEGDAVEPTPPPRIVSPAAPLAPPTKGKRGATVWILLILIIAFVGLRSAPSSMDNNEQESTKTEARETMEDLANLAKVPTESDPAIIDVSTPAKTETVRELQEIVKKQLGMRKDYDELVASLKVEEIFTAKTVSTKAGRQQSRERLEKWRSSTMAFYKELGGMQDQVASLAARMSDKPSAELAYSKRMLREAQSDAHTAFVAGGELLDLGDRYKPQYSSQEDILLFSTDAQVTAYNNKASKFGKAVDAWVQTEMEWEKSRIKRFKARIGEFKETLH